jgi:hypothetical protein
MRGMGWSTGVSAPEGQAPTARPRRPTSRDPVDAVLVSVGATCPQIAEEADARDGDDRHDEEFHIGSLLGPGVVTVDDRHHPSAIAATYTRT